MSSNQPEEICSLDELDFEFVTESQSVAIAPESQSVAIAPVDTTAVKTEVTRPTVGKPKATPSVVSNPTKPASSPRPAAVSAKPKPAEPETSESMPRRARFGGKTVLLLLFLGLTITGVAWFFVDRYRDVSNGDIYRRTETILTRHVDLRRGDNAPGERQQLIRDAETFRDEVVPILSRSTSRMRNHRQHLLVAIRDHMLPMVRSTLSKESEHERTFLQEFGKAKELLRDPNDQWHREPSDDEPEKPARKRITKK